MVIRFELSNGVKVGAFRFEHLNSITLNWLVRAGSVVDPVGKNGAAHLMEHMLVQGIPDLPNIENFGEFVESKAGYFNAHTSSNAVDFVMKLPNRYLKDLIRIGAQVFFSPLFPQAALERERNAMLEELYSDIGTTNYNLSRFFMRSKFSSESLMLKEVGGVPQDVKKLEMKDLIDYYCNYFHPTNLKLAIVGNFDPVEMKNLIEKEFVREDLGMMKKDFKLNLPKFRIQDLNPERFHFRLDQNIHTVCVDLSFPTLSAEDKLDDKVGWGHSIVCAALVNLHKSRLYTLLRNKTGLVYSISMNDTAVCGLGFSNISFDCSMKNLEEVLRVVVEHLREMKENGLNPNEFQYIRSFIRDQNLIRFDSPGAILDKMMNALIWDKKFWLVEDYDKLIEQLTLEDINEVVKKYWNLNKLNLTIQANEELGDERIVKLKALILA